MGTFMVFVVCLALERVLPIFVASAPQSPQSGFHLLKQGEMKIEWHLKFLASLVDPN